MATPRWLLPGLLVVGLLLASCLPGANEQLGVPRPAAELAGFWLGAWHGLVFPVSFLVSLFKDGVGVYEVHNVGAWYDFGYFLGLSACMGGPGHGSGRVWRRGR